SADEQGRGERTKKIVTLAADGHDESVSPERRESAGGGLHGGNRAAVAKTRLPAGRKGGRCPVRRWVTGPCPGAGAIHELEAAATACTKAWARFVIVAQSRAFSAFASTRALPAAVAHAPAL